MEEKPPRGPETDEGEARSHQLPGALVQTLFSAVLGALPAGLGITFATEPGTHGAAIFGILVPWSAGPFIGSAAMAWWRRSSTSAKSLANRTTLTAILGACAYGYAFLGSGGVADARRWFTYVPIWQWLLLAIPLTKALKSKETPPFP